MCKIITFLIYVNKGIEDFYINIKRNKNYVKLHLK